VVEQEEEAVVYAAGQGKYVEHAHTSSSSSRYRSRVRPRARYPAEFARVRGTPPSSREFARVRELESARSSTAGGDEASSSADLMQQQQRHQLQHLRELQDRPMVYSETISNAASVRRDAAAAAAEEEEGADSISVRRGRESVQFEFAPAARAASGCPPL
jgi:hypothetical protein